MCPFCFIIVTVRDIHFRDRMILSVAAKQNTATSITISSPSACQCSIDSCFTYVHHQYDRFVVYGASSWKQLLYVSMSKICSHLAQCFFVNTCLKPIILCTEQHAWILRPRAGPRAGVARGQRGLCAGGGGVGGLFAGLMRPQCGRYAPRRAALARAQRGAPSGAPCGATAACVRGCLRGRYAVRRAGTLRV